MKWPVTLSELGWQVAKTTPQWQLAPSSVAFCPNGVEKRLISENRFFLIFGCKLNLRK